ncbi:MAG: hypothetical protein HYS73_00345 [Parcubacteria group bacterium]|nr:hypothetical protein [Parcubacteria group bacterium]
MSSPSKLSLLIITAGFFLSPLFANAAWSFPSGIFDVSFQIQNSKFKIPSLSDSLSFARDMFSLKNLDARIYARLVKGGNSQIAQGEAGGDDYGRCWAYQPIGGCPACDDNSDNDGDGKKDYPNDPGCSSFLDTSEYGTAQCDDGVDNDEDGRIDWRPGGYLTAGDFNCDSLTDHSESGYNPLLPPPLAEESQGAFNPSVALFFDSNPLVTSVTIPGNAYQTYATIYWEVQDSCNTAPNTCVSTPGGWWNGVLDDSGDGTGSVGGISISNPSGAVAYSLTCHKLPCNSTDNSPQNDFVTVTPAWAPSFSFSSPTLQVTSNDDVLLEWSGNDLKSCTAGGWDGPSASSLQTANSGALGQNQTHSVNLGKITRDTTYTLSCTGFDDIVLPQQTVNVTLLRNPTPYFFINSINLIIIGPGSGGRSNKATVGVTPGGGFTGTIDLSAARPPALVSANATLHISPTSISCTDPNPDNGITSDITCTTAEFWVETQSDIPEDTYTITLTADPVPSGFDSKTADIPLRVRRFVPAFEEI